jgi:hypothetical protein
MSLSDKRYGDMFFNDEFGYIEEDVKEKVQNSKKKLKESINSESLYSSMAKDWVIKEIDKIFSEEFGDKLI